MILSGLFSVLNHHDDPEDAAAPRQQPQEEEEQQQQQQQQQQEQEQEDEDQEQSNPQDLQDPLERVGGRRRRQQQQQQQQQQQYRHRSHRQHQQQQPQQSTTRTTARQVAGRRHRRRYSRLRPIFAAPLFLLLPWISLGMVSYGLLWMLVFLEPQSSTHPSLPMISTTTSTFTQNSPDNTNHENNHNQNKNMLLKTFSSFWTVVTSRQQEHEQPHEPSSFVKHTDNEQHEEQQKPGSDRNVNDYLIKADSNSLLQSTTTTTNDEKSDNNIPIQTKRLQENSRSRQDRTRNRKQPSIPIGKHNNINNNKNHHLNNGTTFEDWKVWLLCGAFFVISFLRIQMEPSRYNSDYYTHFDIPLVDNNNNNDPFHPQQHYHPYNNDHFRFPFFPWQRGGGRRRRRQRRQQSSRTAIHNNNNNNTTFSNERLLLLQTLQRINQGRVLRGQEPISLEAVNALQQALLQDRNFWRSLAYRNYEFPRATTTRRQSQPQHVSTAAAAGATVQQLHECTQCVSFSEKQKRQSIAKRQQQQQVEGDDDDDDDEEECAICLNGYQPNDELLLLSCHHGFHIDCIDRWLQQSTVCPICRSELVPIPTTTTTTTTDAS